VEDQISSDTQFAVAEAFRLGSDVIDANNESAFNWYRRSANKGNAAAMNNMGNMYLHGLGTEQDLTQAARWFKSAADNNDSYGQLNYGYLRVDGKGVEKNVEDGMEWIKKSAANGNEEAKKYLSKRNFPFNFLFK
jgi:TPR repeat protein